MTSFFSRIHNTKDRAGGFTLVELMISMTIFTILVTIGIGSVLSALNQHFVTTNIRSIVDSLNFTMEDMSRNIRTSGEIRCVVSGDIGPYTNSTDDVMPANCPALAGSNKIVFKAIDGTNVTYVMTAPTATTDPSSILKVSGDTGIPEVIIPPEVKINFAKSGFTVTGATGSDKLQPRVTIRLSGTITYKNVTSPFSIETTVTARQLDS